jgi:lincosamide nucleotidyltransferase A/C/D/E
VENKRLAPWNQLLLAVRKMGRVLRSTKLAPLARSRPALWVWRKILAPGVTEVHGLLDEFGNAGIPVWLAGGWGVDALLGHPTRRHDDIDLVIPKGYEAESATILSGRGYHVINEEVRTIWFPHRMTWRDNIGRSIDLLPVPITDEREAVSCTPDSFTTGKLGGRPLACLSAEMQLELHRGYTVRDIDRIDIASLCRLVGKPVPVELQ